LTGKLSDRVYDYILGQIVIGAFALNARLPTEEQLSQRAGVSRPIVREALKRLREDQVIISKQGAGSYVVRRPAQQVLSFAPVGSVADIQRCFIFRIAVESEAAALAAQNQNPALLKKLKSALADLLDALSAGREAAEEDLAFHNAIALASDNHFFVSTMVGISDQIRVGVKLNRLLTLTQPKERLARVEHEHQAIFDAISAGNPEKAKQTMRDHLENARLRVFEGRNID